MNEVIISYQMKYGWYMKCQSDLQTLAVIPAVHQNGKNIDRPGKKWFIDKVGYSKYHLDEA